MANLSNINGKFVVEQTTGYVGVGTTDPSYPIEVLNASAEIALNASSGSIYRVQSDNASNFIIRKEGVGDRLVINSAGNATFAGSVITPTVITDNVVAKTSSGNITFKNNGGSTIAQFANDLSATFLGTYVRSQYSSTRYVQLESNSSGGVIKGIGGNGFLVRSYGDTYFNGGNVGIGTTSPGRGLTIDKSNANAALEIIKNNTTNQIVYLGTGSSAGTDDPILQMKHNGTENIRLYSTGISWLLGGNVGIGTATPAEKLEVSGSVKIGNMKFEPSSGGRIGFNRNTSNGVIYDSNYSAFQINGANASANYLDFQNYNSSGVFLGQFVFFDGKMGIGIVAPSAKLHVNGTSKLGGGPLYVSSDSSFSSNFTYTFRDGVGINNPNSASATPNAGYTMCVGRSNSGGVSGSLSAVGTIRASAFTVGINTTAGIAASNGDVNAAEVGPGYINLSRDDTAAAQQIRFEKNGALHSYFETTTSGLNIGNTNVGIGVTDPKNKLNIFSGTDTMMGFWGSSTYSAMQSVNLANTQLKDMRFDFDKAFFIGNAVGIGTTTPGAYKLNVDGGDITVSGSVFDQNGVRTYRNGGYMNNGVAYTFDITVPNDSGNGTVHHVDAMMTHYDTAYGCVLNCYAYTRGTAVSTQTNLVNQTSALAGGWFVTKPNSTTLRITKTAGTYVGSGNFQIVVITKST